MTWTSLFCSAGTSWVWSVMMRKTSLSSFGFSLPYHLGFGVSVTEVFLSWALMMYGPAETGSGLSVNHFQDAARSPCCLAMCAGYMSPNGPFQSAYGFL